MSVVIRKTFADWTEGLSSVESRISIFNHIRDIPYAIIPDLNNPVSGPEGLLKGMSGSCAPKHFLLGIMFDMLHVPARYVTFPFSWNTKSIAYPPELRRLVETSPIGLHLACKAKIDKKWVALDATWDRPLARVGFPVNDNWNGMDNTRLAVKPLGENVHENAQGCMQLLQDSKRSRTPEEQARADRFIIAFGNWLDTVRETEP